MDIKELAQKLYLKIPNEKIYINEPMSKHTTFKIGGNADIFIKIKKIEDIKYILEINKEFPITVIGNGSNILVKDDGIRGIVLKISIEEYKIEQNSKVLVGAGMLNAKLAQILLKEGISGFEFAAGIPGTIGGGIRMNAGAYGSQMSDIVEKTTYIDLEDKKIKQINNNQHEFSYRHSFFENKKCIILNTILNLKNSKKENILKTMEENFKNRKEKQPIEIPSAGSVFKRGNNFITAKLIEESGLKGYKIGGAQISTKHAGFIVNTGDATAKDVIKLIDIIKQKIYEKFNKEIELEIEIIGE